MMHWDLYVEPVGGSLSHVGLPTPPRKDFAGWVQYVSKISEIDKDAMVTAGTDLQIEPFYPFPMKRMKA